MINWIKEKYEKYKENKEYRTKYNTLELLYNEKCDNYDDKVIELHTQQKINKIETQKFEQAIDELTQKLVKEKMKNKKKKEG